jgi:hypothetical protein
LEPAAPHATRATGTGGKGGGEGAEEKGRGGGQREAARQTPKHKAHRTWTGTDHPTSPWPRPKARTRTEPAGPREPTRTEAKKHAQNRPTAREPTAREPTRTRGPKPNREQDPNKEKARTTYGGADCPSLGRQATYGDKPPATTKKRQPRNHSPSRTEPKPKNEQGRPTEPRPRRGPPWAEGYGWDDGTQKAAGPGTRGDPAANREGQGPSQLTAVGAQNHFSIPQLQQSGHLLPKPARTPSFDAALLCLRT